MLLLLLLPCQVLDLTSPGVTMPPAAWLSLTRHLPPDICVRLREGAVAPKAPVLPVGQADNR